MPFAAARAYKHEIDGNFTTDLAQTSAYVSSTKIPGHLGDCGKPRLFLVFHLSKEALERIFTPSSALIAHSSDEGRCTEEAKSQNNNPRKREVDSPESSTDHGLLAFTPSSESAPKRRRVAPRQSTSKATNKKTALPPVRLDLRLPSCAQPEVWAEVSPLCHALKVIAAYIYLRTGLSSAKRSNISTHSKVPLPLNMATSAECSLTKIVAGVRTWMRQSLSPERKAILILTLSSR